MKAPVIVIASAYVPLVPALVGPFRNVRAYPPARRIWIWACVTAALNLFAVVLMLGGTANLWIEHLAVPIDVITLVAALMAMSESKRTRTWMFVTACVYVAIWTALSATIETASALPAYTGTIRTLMLTPLLLVTWVARTGSSTLELKRDGARLILIGLLLIFVPDLATEVVARRTFVQRPDIANAMYVTRACFWLIGFPLIAVGLAWPWTTMPSGLAGSLPRLSYSSSLLDRSGR